jgi:hypothetical protein
MFQSAKKQTRTLTPQTTPPDSLTRQELTHEFDFAVLPNCVVSLEVINDDYDHVVMRLKNIRGELL